jgi:hypothetical protein
MRTPSLIYALTNDEDRVVLNRARAARQATREVAREVARTERRERRANRHRRPRLDWPFRYRPAVRIERGPASCRP